MGFPIWTLWGMGLSALGALLATVLAYMAQSPQFLARAGLSGYRLDLRTRAFTGFALAAMLLAGGFFLAGVPLEGLAMVTPTAQPITAVSPTIQSIPAAEGTLETAVPTSKNNTQTPQSGAFSGPPPTATTEIGEGTVVSSSPSTATATQAANAPGPSATPSSQPTARPTNTPTLTPTPTITPTPTLTPTPIEGETAVVNIGSSTVWLRRTPGGSNLILAQGGDTVILQPGHANQAGILWQEVMTLDGTVGWVQQDFLATTTP